MQKPLFSILALSTALLVAQQPPTSCGIPARLVNTSQPTTIVGNGTPASCTEQAFLSAMAAGGIITFNCGPSPVTIPITAQRQFRNDMDTVIDGGNRVTLRGSGTTRMFLAQSGDAPWRGGTPPYYKSTRTAVTFQRITLTNGRSSGPAIPPLPSGAPSTCSQGTELQGGGGLIYVRDMVLRVINSKVVGNYGPPLGPDVAGGAIYTFGSLETTLVGNTFEGNQASNGGAFGTLMSDVTVVNNVFQNNRAVGHDGNHDIQSSGCPIHLNQYQVGFGGSGGAVYHDGQATTRGVTYCGNVFKQNLGGSNAMGGALWGTGDQGTLDMVITQSEFEGNRGAKGGAVFVHDSRLTVTRSTFTGNVADIGGGAMQIHKTDLKALNNTFAGNSAIKWVGAIAHFSGSGVIRNNTFANNRAPQYPVLFPGDPNTPPVPLTVANNIFVSNVKTGPGFIACYSSFPGNSNVLWPAVGVSPAAEAGCALGVQMVNPNLGPLANNGGKTRTMAIPSNSPAARIGTSCPALDQRGVARPVACAAGAFEPPLQ